MYYLILIILAGVIVANPEKVSGAVPGMNEDEKQQLCRGLQSISQGVSDTTNAGLNAFLRKIMGGNKD